MMHPLIAHCESLGLQHLLASFHRDSVSYRALRASRAQLDDALGTVVDLLCLNTSVSLDLAVEVLGDGVTSLLAHKVATQTDGTICLPSARIVDHYGHLIFVGKLGEHTGGYYGPDSVGLGRLLLRARGASLDLFASTGAQTVLLGAAGTTVTTVELDENLSDVFALNMDMHGLAKHVTPVWGDVLTADWGTKAFDTVSINAPLFPSFGLTGLDIGADGGFDGHQLLQRTLPRIQLTGSGRLYSTATMVGANDGPDVTWLQNLTAATGFGFDVVVTGTGKLGTDTSFGREVINTLSAATEQTYEATATELVQLWRSANTDRVFFCLITARPQPRPQVRVLSRYEGGKGWWL